MIMKKIEINYLFLWKDNKSLLKTNNKVNGVLLNDIVVSRAERINLLYILDKTNKICGMQILKKGMRSSRNYVTQVLPENKHTFLNYMTISALSLFIYYF